MKDFVIHLHSGLRWVVLIMFVMVLVNAYKKWKAGETYALKDKTLNKFTIHGFHLQIVIGLILYFWQKHYELFEYMDDSKSRFFAIEHMLGMIIAAGLVSVGHKRAIKSERDSAKHRKVFIWFAITLAVILISIPWPFRFESSGWF